MSQAHSICSSFKQHPMTAICDIEIYDQIEKPFADGIAFLLRVAQPTALFPNVTYKHQACLMGIFVCTAETLMKKH